MYSQPYPSPHPWPALYPHDYHALTHDSSIGPSRVLTRRQRAALEHGPGPRHDQHMYSRPQTPPSQPEYQQQLTMPASYHPLTPSSSASPYSTYGFYSTTHSRANSLSNTTNPRSASPALSTTSALTSVSSTPDALAARIKQKKQRLFNVDRKEICLYHKENPNARQEDIARIYGVERSTISKILKNKTKWLNVPAEENLRVAKHRPSKFPEIEEDMVKWLLQCRDSNTVLSDSMIKTKAKEIARELGIQEERFKASSGWIENFKHRHGVRAGVWTGDGKNVRAARALGLGPPPGSDQQIQDAPPLLSPLNHAFDRDDDEDDDMLGGADVPEPELELNEPEEVRVRRIAATGSGDIIRPSWLDAPPPPPPSVPPPHPSVPPSRQLADHGAPQYAYDVYHQQQHQQQPDPASAPTLAEAEDALNKVIRFFDTSAQAHGLRSLQPGERNVLSTIKCALFQAATGGMVYDPSGRGVAAYDAPGEAR